MLARAARRFFKITATSAGNVDPGGQADGISPNSAGPQRVASPKLFRGWWLLAPCVLALQACGEHAGAKWAPADQMTAQDVRADLNQFALMSDSVISLRVSYSPSSVRFRPPKYREVSGAEYDRIRSAQEAQVLQGKIAPLGLPASVQVIGMPAPNTGNNLLVTVNYDIEGAPADYSSTITLRQGNRFASRKAAPKKGMVNSINVTDEGRALSSLHAQSNAFLASVLPQMDAARGMEGK